MTLDDYLVQLRERDSELFEDGAALRLVVVLLNEAPPEVVSELLTRIDGEILHRRNGRLN